jgi:hypothetical protein
LWQKHNVSNYILCFLASCSYVTMGQYAAINKKPYLTKDRCGSGCAQKRLAYCGHTLHNLQYLEQNIHTKTIRKHMERYKYSTSVKSTWNMMHRYTQKVQAERRFRTLPKSRMLASAMSWVLNTADLPGTKTKTDSGVILLSKSLSKDRYCSLVQVPTRKYNLQKWVVSAQCIEKHLWGWS